MSAVPAASKQRPPSPPQSNDGDFDLRAVQRHIVGLSRESLDPPIKSHGLSEHTTEQYGDPTDFQTAISHVYYPSQTGFHGTNHPTTPPTTGYDDVIKTRSGRALGSPLTSANPETSRRSKSPRPRAKRRPRQAKAPRRTIELSEPLSALTKDWALPLGDIKAKVHRSAEQRQEEVNSKKNNGKVPRPMNSFMLYRSAYAERVKEYCREGNHQVISQVTGASWALEPQEVKELYEKYADIDRQNHQKAHPDYKFAPNKNGPASRKRKGQDDEDDQTDWEDRDYDAGGSSAKRSRYGQSVESRSHSSTPFETVGQPAYGAVAQRHTVNPSSYHASNPRSMPTLNPTDIGNHYYEQWATPFRTNIQDVHVRRVQNPGAIQYDGLGTQSLVGLPQAHFPTDILPRSDYETPEPVHIDPLDPRLSQHGPYDPYPQYEVDDPTRPVETRHDYGQDEFFTDPQYLYTEGSAHPGMATLTSPRGPWDQPLAGAEFEKELVKWR